MPAEPICQSPPSHTFLALCRPLMTTAIMGHITAARDGLMVKASLDDGVSPPSDGAGGPSGGEAGSDPTDPVNVNAQDDRGFTALHYAVEGGHVGFVEMLLSRGADVSILGAPSPSHPDGVTAASLAFTPGMKGLLASLAPPATGSMQASDSPSHK